MTFKQTVQELGVKTALEQYRYCDERIRIINSIIQAGIDTSLPSVIFDTPRVQTSPNLTRFEDNIISTLDEFEDLTIEREELQLYRIDVRTAIRNIPDLREGSVLYKVYILGEEHRKVADDLGIHLRTVSNVLNRGLSVIAEQVDKWL